MKDLVVRVPQLGCLVHAQVSGSRKGTGSARLVCSVEGDDERGRSLSIAVSSSESVTLHWLEAHFGYLFVDEDLVLVNGYQCWTQTAEEGPDGRTVGIKRVPSSLVSKYSLDRAGDYLFAEYPNTPGVQHGWTYGYVRTPASALSGEEKPKRKVDGVDVLSKRALRELGPLPCPDDQVTLWASLDESQGFTQVCADMTTNTFTVRRELPADGCKVGDGTPVARLFVASGDADSVFQQWFATLGMKPRTNRGLAGYTSWYRHYENIDENAIAHDLIGTASMMAEVRRQKLVENTDLLFQIDDGWQIAVGDWEANGKFPGGMASLAESIEEEGLLPGLWMAPFAVAENSALFVEHPEWLVADEAGDPVRMGPNWGGYYALDLGVSEAREYVVASIRRAVEWGYKVLKLDFLAIAAQVVPGDTTRGARMADAMALLREAAGDEVRILACGVPLASCFGVADYCRVGCDVGLNWDDAPHMRFAHAERISTRNSLRDAYFRRQLDGCAFGSDPDVIFIREKGLSLKSWQRDLLTWVQCHCGSVLLTSDDMGGYDREQRKDYLSLVARWSANRS